MVAANIRAAAAVVIDKRFIAFSIFNSPRLSRDLAAYLPLTGCVSRVLVRRIRARNELLLLSAFFRLAASVSRDWRCGVQSEQTHCRR